MNGPVDVRTESRQHARRKQEAGEVAPAPTGVGGGVSPETLALQRGSEGQGQGGSWQALDGSDIEPPLLSRLSRGFILKT